MNTISSALARYVTELQFANLPADVVDMAKKCILDSMGNMICGRYSPTGELALQYVQNHPQHTQGESQVSLIGGGKVSKESCVLAHAVMARGADLDDGHRYAMGHPGSVIVPAALITGELCGCTGEEVLTAIVAGYDVYCRIGAAINPSSYKEKGFDATGVCGAVACAAVIGRLRGLDAETLANALGVASLFTGGLIEYQNDGTMGKVLCGYWAIRNAMEAVQLAQAGFTGPERALEGQKGLFQAFSNAPDDTKVLAELGEDFKIKETYFKMHACMRGLHAAIDALLDLAAKEGLTADAVSRIEVRTTPFVGRLSKPRPTTAIGAQCSIEFALAVALTNGHIAQEHLLTEALGDEGIYELASRIQLVMDGEIDAYVKQHPSHWAAVNMLVHTVDGRRLEQWMPLPRGEMESPFGWEQLREKFERLIEGTPYQPHGAALRKAIEEFDTLKDWAQLYTPWESTHRG